MSQLGSDIADWTLLRRQDAEAFARLVQAHQRVVLGLCQSLGLRGADLDDAAAEVFAEVYRALPGFDARSSLGTWIYRIAWRTIVRVRAKLRSRPGELLDANWVDTAQRTPADLAQQSETQQRLWAAVAALEPRQAAAVELYYRREWPLDEIAAMLECPVGTVKTLLYRARQRLETMLTREGIHP